MEKLLHALSNSLVAQNRDLRAVQSSLLEMQLMMYQNRFLGSKALQPLACHSESYFSQNGEDGILSEIFRRLGRPLERCIEIGAGDGAENNTLYRVLNGAKALWVEGAEKNVSSIRELHAHIIASGNLQVLQATIHAENINDVIRNSVVGAEIDLLTIDIDGNDYWVWQAVSVARPPVVVVEYNAFFGPDSTWVMEYNPKHSWSGGHVYYGASLGALVKLSREKGYSLVGCDFMGVNSFFVRDDLLKDGNFPGPHEARQMFQPFRGTLGKCRKGKRVRVGPYRLV